MRERRYNENYSDSYACIEPVFDAGMDGELIGWLEEEKTKILSRHIW